MLRFALCAMVLTSVLGFAAPRTATASPEEAVANLREILNESLVGRAGSRSLSPGEVERAVRLEYVGVGVNHYQVAGQTARQLRRLEKSLGGRFGILGEQKGGAVAARLRSLQCLLAGSPGGPDPRHEREARQRVGQIYRELDTELARLARTSALVSE